MRRGCVLALLASCAPAAPVEPAPPPVVVSVPEPVTPAPEPAPPTLTFGEASHLTSFPKGTKYVDGLPTFVIRGTDGGRSPVDQDEVLVRFVAWTPDGRVVDQALEPKKLRMGTLLEGWRRALEMMRPGERRRAWIPEKLGVTSTTEQVDDPTWPRGDHVVDLELVAIVEPPGAPPVPPNLNHPPLTATKTASGLAFVVLSKGHGTRHPTPANRVEVHYTGWDMTGRMFDSSVTRGRPATFPLTAVIKGWTEGLQLMVAGDTFRFWMPGHLAYGNQPRPGRPTGMLVFDIELLAIR